MEPLIIDSTPKGSAILAYGRSRGPRWNPKLLAVVAGSLALIVIVVFGFWYAQLMIVLPTDRLILISLRPSSVGAKLSPALRQDLPAPWRAALETRSSFPAFFGIALDAEDKPRAFAVVARTSTVVGGSNLGVEPHGVMIVLTDGHAFTSEDVPFHELVSLGRRMRRHSAAWTVRGDLLERLSSFELERLSTERSVEVHGTWDVRSGHIEITPERTAAAEPLNAAMFAVLGEPRADVQPALNGLLSQGIDLRTINQAPATISLDPTGDHTLSFSWQNELEPRDAALLAAARGLEATGAFTLPDQTVIPEFRLDHASSTPPGGTLLFLGDLASSTFIDPPNTATADKNCPGVIRFSLEGPALDGVLTVWNIPSSWKNEFHRVFLTENSNGADICIN